MDTVSSVRQIPSVMTIAGSDSGGGAGIQADLRTFAALGTFGTSVITAVTAQNPAGITAVEEISAATVGAQIRAILEMIPPRAVKCGMLFSAQIMEETANAFSGHSMPLIIDPVMISSSGRPLLKGDAIETLQKKILPLADWITPNIPEAEFLCARKITTLKDVLACAELCAEKWACSVILKGGHAQDQSQAGDLVYHQGRAFLLKAPRTALQARADHGTGCTFSAAFAALLAKGTAYPEAARQAKAFVLGSLRETVLPCGGSQRVMYPPAKGIDFYREQITCEEL